MQIKPSGQQQIKIFCGCEWAFANLIRIFVQYIFTKKIKFYLIFLETCFAFIPMIFGTLIVYVLAEKDGEIKKFCPKPYSAPLTTLQIFALMKEDHEHLFKFPKDPKFTNFIQLPTGNVFRINDLTRLPLNYRYGLPLSCQ